MCLLLDQRHAKRQPNANQTPIVQFHACIVHMTAVDARSKSRPTSHLFLAIHARARYIVLQETKIPCPSSSATLRMVRTFEKRTIRCYHMIPPWTHRNGQTEKHTPCTYESNMSTTSRWVFRTTNTKLYLEQTHHWQRCKGKQNWTQHNRFHENRRKSSLPRAVISFPHTILGYFFWEHHSHPQHVADPAKAHRPPGSSHLFLSVNWDNTMNFVNSSSSSCAA